jgi:3'-phosphoadenosine 5'-phosphosulfate sulfotransferase (PAPS reductase)/FAD synthetase
MMSPYQFANGPVSEDVENHLNDPDGTVVVSVSGGCDSDATAIRMRQLFPSKRIILWHALLHGMDWLETDHHLDVLADTIGNAERVTVQAVHELTGKRTPTGYNSTRFRRVHDVTANGPATDDDQNAITTLLQFAERARNGMPPTKSIRYCTSYFKTMLFDAWLCRNRGKLGPRAVLASGERWAESSDRAKIAEYEWRGVLKPSGGKPSGWRMLWVRPVVSWRFHEVVRFVTGAGMDPHPGYFAQGETLEGMQSPWREERGRARLSCVFCIFTRGQHLRSARLNSPESVSPALASVEAFETRTGRSWRQDEFSADLLTDVKTELPLWDYVEV